MTVQSYDGDRMGALDHKAGLSYMVVSPPPRTRDHVLGRLALQLITDFCGLLSVIHGEGCFLFFGVFC